jgi:type IV pilus assembly protein PilC
MKQFAYLARDKAGTKVEGLIESATTEQAARTLQERKLLVINIHEKREFTLDAILGSLTGSRVSAREVATFTRLLATMLGTGLPLTDALYNLVTQTHNGALREIIQAVLHDVQSGVSLSETLSHNNRVFDNLYINMVKAGEAAGRMDDALEKLAEMLESNLDFQSKVKGAMIYPAVVTVAMGGIGVFMITTIIPKIAAVYEEFGAELPGPTRVLIAISDLLRNYTIFVFLFAVLAYFTLRTLKKNPVSEMLINNAMFKTPVMGALWAEVDIAVICRTLGTLLSSGVAILEALKIVSKIMPNNYFRAGLIEASVFVEKGLPLSAAIRRNPDFPLIMSQLLAIGEETGTVDKSLNQLAKFYQDSAERKVKALTTLLEPVMILFMGGMVAMLALAVLMPMFNLVNVIK